MDISEANSLSSNQRILQTTCFTMVQNPAFSVLGSYAILQFDSHEVIRKSLIPRIPTSFFVANLFQLCLNKLTVLLRISTLAKMSANLSILAILKTVLENRESDNRHAISKLNKPLLLYLHEGEFST